MTPLAPEFPDLAGESQRFRLTRRERWHHARSRHSDQWHGKTTRTGRPDFTAEAEEEALDGGNYVGAEIARHRPPSPETDLSLAALAFELAWLALWRHRNRFEAPTVARPAIAILTQLRDAYARPSESPR